MDMGRLVWCGLAWCGFVDVDGIALRKLAGMHRRRTRAEGLGERTPSNRELAAKAMSHQQDCHLLTC